MVKENGKSIKEELKNFEEFTSDCILVAQNTEFDINFLTVAQLEQGYINGKLNLDLMKISMLLFPFENEYKLSHLTELYNVDYDKNNHHRALYDCEITAKCFVEALKICENRYGVLNINQLLQTNNFQRKYALMSDKQMNYLKDQCNDYNIDLQTQYLSKKNINKIISYLVEYGDPKCWNKIQKEKER